MSQSTFVGRQPIVDRDQHVVAYELLFRSSADAQVAEFDSVGRAALRVVVNTFASLGSDAVLGRALGFFNLNEEILLSESIEALPKDRVVLEILEDVRATEAVIARCRALNAAGYTIALDDWVPGDTREALLPWASIVKVDLPAAMAAGGTRALRSVVRALGPHGVQLLAEKVETAEEFATCSKLGFDLFQGYFFAKPVVLEGADLDATRGTLLQVLQQISAEAEIPVLVEPFKQDAKLGLNLLRLVNTAGQATRVRLDTIEGAVRHLGRQQLGRWVAILLYAQGPDSNLDSPLLTTAARRGRLMELITGASEMTVEMASRSERAFLVGMLSLADALLGRPLSRLVDELSLAEELAGALVERSGDLGELLALVESIERGDAEKFMPALDARQLDVPTLQTMDNAAHAWVHGLTAPAAESTRRVRGVRGDAATRARRRRHARAR